jgi:hypothetical protein
VADFGARLSGGKASELAGLSNALSAREGLPILPLDRQTFLNVQVCARAARAAGSEPHVRPATSGR